MATLDRMLARQNILTGLQMGLLTAEEAERSSKTSIRRTASRMKKSRASQLGSPGHHI